ncbi:MAG TPA: response regulator [Oxalicibacterium sp.]|jgi:YesN/AraC family two-component response regulator|nr:response regulator [Oxalicibacterium sp.]
MLPSRLSFVIADDDRMTRNVLRMLLNENQHRIVGEAADGEKAIELCRQHQPDIAFLDIDMPHVDGHAAARAIRESCLQTHIVMISSLATLPNVQQALEAGASGFVVKPFNSAKLDDVVQQCQRKIAAAGKIAGNL